MTTLERPGVPGGGFKTVGQIDATNNLVFQRNQNAMGVAVELLATHTPGAWWWMNGANSSGSSASSTSFARLKRKRT